MSRFAVGDRVRYVAGGRFAGDVTLPGNVQLMVGDQLVIHSVPGVHGELGCTFGTNCFGKPCKVSLNVADVECVAADAPARSVPVLAAPAEALGAGSDAAAMQAVEPVITFSVRPLSANLGRCHKTVGVLGATLGDLRAGVRRQFGIPSFEQKILYDPGDGEFVALDGDDSVLMEEKPGLKATKVLKLSHQVDPRFKTEKETAFCELLVVRRFVEAKELLDSSGIAVDPGCVHSYCPKGKLSCTECGYRVAHPALTVALQAGLEIAVSTEWKAFSWDAARKMKIAVSNDSWLQGWRVFMSQEQELYELVQLMIEKRADVNANGSETHCAGSSGDPTISGKTPLCAAVQRGSPTLVRLLIDAGADPNHRHTYETSDWGPDKSNPFGPGELRPESWLSNICIGAVHKRNNEDPRNEHKDEILRLLRRAGGQPPPGPCGAKPGSEERAQGRGYPRRAVGVRGRSKGGRKGIDPGEEGDAAVGDGPAGKAKGKKGKGKGKKP